MVCWDCSSELRSQKPFTGEWVMPESGAGAWVPGTDPQRRNPLEARVPHVVSLRRITMTAEHEARSTSSASQTLVLYDGVCGLCNWLVAFLIRHDGRGQFRFAPLQSEFAQALLRRHDLNTRDFDTVVVLANFGQPSERALTRSDAALWSVDQLGGMWKVFAIAKLLPLSLREVAYRFIARYRYQVFGKHDQCPLPRPEDRHKFLG